MMAHRFTAEGSQLEPVRFWDTVFAVRDTAGGGIWWPSSEALDEAATSDDPDAALLRICDEQPMRGTWQQ